MRNGKSGILAFALFVSGFISCKTGLQGDVVKDYSAWPAYSHYFTDNPSRLVFKSSLTIANERFSGLLVVKQIVPGEYRSIYTTETGFKVFDLSIENDSYVLNYGVGAISKKMVSDRLAFTIQSMLLREFSSSAWRMLPAETGFYVQEYLFGNNRYLIKRKSALYYPVSMSFYKGQKKKAETIFWGTEDGGLPDSSSVTHTGFPMQASFRLLKD